jgi:bifunctional non-homologous end joining protein LigD
VLLSYLRVERPEICEDGRSIGYQKVCRAAPASWLSLGDGWHAEKLGVAQGTEFKSGEKRLGVQVEDHPLAYGGFEGLISQDQYGGARSSSGIKDGGRVKSKAIFVTGVLTSNLHGDKLRGGWALVQIKGRAGGGGKNWLLIKQRDNQARGQRGQEDADMFEECPDRAASG